MVTATGTVLRTRNLGWTPLAPNRPAEPSPLEAAQIALMRAKAEAAKRALEPPQIKSGLGTGGIIGGTTGGISTPQVGEATGALAGAIGAQRKLGQQALEDAYNRNVRAKVNQLSSRGLSPNPRMSSIANEDIADVGKNFTQGLADLEARLAANRFNMEGQQVATARNLAGIGLDERRQRVLEQQGANQRLNMILGM